MVECIRGDDGAGEGTLDEEAVVSNNFRLTAVNMVDLRGVERGPNSTALDCVGVIAKSSLNELIDECEVEDARDLWEPELANNAANDLLIPKIRLTNTSSECWFLISVSFAFFDKQCKPRK